MSTAAETLPAALPERERRRRWLSPAVGAVLLLAAVWVLHRELREVRYREVTDALRSLPPARVLLAFLVTAVNYAILTGFDLLGFAYVGKRVDAWKVAVASFTGYAVSNSVGFALISGTSVRYRFYSRWGLTAGELSQVVLFYFGTFWLGLLVLGGYTLAFTPHPALLALPGGALVRPAGALLLLVAAGYAAAAALHRAPLRLGPLTIPFPPPRLVAGQFGLSVLDWALATGIFYFVLPPGRIGFGELLSAFLAGQILGLLSHVPGGLGVFEGTMMLLLRPYFPAEQIVSALVLYRVLYYLVPLAAALAILVADEVRQRRRHLARLGGAFGALTRQLAPKVLAVFTFLSGAVLLFSGATPAAGGRMGWLGGFVPLAVTEASHVLASVVGVGLLVASNGVARRLDAAYSFAAAGLAAGVAASLLKGADWEVALFLCGVLAALVPTRAEFDRRAAFWAARFSPGWIAAVLAVVGASVWLGSFAYKHVEYTGGLWWEFAVDRSAPRFLRASAGATLAVLAFGLMRLLRPAPPEVRQPSAGELDAAERVIAAQSSTLPYLARLRDKALLFGEAGDAFLMYAVQGRSWVALGGPVGPPERAPELIRAFVERADEFGGDPVFHQVPRDRLHLYADLGLTFAELGEEAFVPLDAFTLDGAAAEPFRLVLNRFAGAGLRFRVVPPGEVPVILPELREVSDAWLRSRGASEEGFSLGFFDPAYLARFPAAVAEEGGRVAAFATVWPGPGKEELSVDLMRFRPGAPRDVMEATLLRLMLWGREEGYARFGLGMAPLAGLELSPPAPARSRVGRFLFDPGEGTCDAQRLRAFQETFHPVWEPRYLAYAPGLRLPRLAADLSALVAGGYRRVFR